MNGSHRAKHCLPDVGGLLTKISRQYYKNYLTGKIEQ
jgi:hypothetical protein